MRKICPLPDGSETRRVAGIGEVRDRLEGEEIVVEPRPGRV